MATYLKQTFSKNTPITIEAIRASVIEAGSKRIRPCLMTTATTILALLPVLTSTGRGSDIMIPMAIPSFGGMLVALITLFVVPVLFSMKEEFSLELRTRDRERKLIKKIEKTLKLIEEDDFGFCNSCGIEIGIRRLEARPTADLCIECKTLAEIKERQMAG